MPLLKRRFTFIDPGPLVDRELELVAPQQRWIDDVLVACRDPETVRQMPREARLSAEDIRLFLAESPLGRFAGDEATGRVPSYQFWMMLRHGAAGPGVPPPLRIAGGISLRVGSTPTVELYYGHLGYHVYPAARGQGYAYRACRLVLTLFKAHGMNEICITCDPTNVASQRTIRRLGGEYIETVAVPMGDPLYDRGERIKQRYRLEL